jgi:hypothetical protein
MENKDKMDKDVGNTSASDMDRSKLDKSKDESQSNFGKNIGGNKDISNEPNRRSGSVDSSGMKGTGKDLKSEDAGSSKSSGGSERH